MPHEVIPSDREAAADFMSKYPEYVWDGRTIVQVRGGQKDDCHPVQAFAAHRLSHSTPSPEASFQSRVQPWMMECFGVEIAADKVERCDRFIEEALELVQASGYSRDRALALVDYVYGRPQGEVNQEVGGVMVTLAAHCLAFGVDMHEAGETELARINNPETVLKIRAKQATKPKHSPLPAHSTPATEDWQDIATAPKDRHLERLRMVCGLGQRDSVISLASPPQSPRIFNMNKTDAAGLVERLRALATTWRKHVEAVERMNAAIPPLEATAAERALYGERYKAKDVAEREMRATAMRFAQWCAETDIAESLSAPPLGELCGKLRATEVKVTNFATNRTSPPTIATFEALINPDGPEAARVITALMARVAEAEKVLRTIAEGEEPRPIGKPWRNDGKPSKNDKCTHDRWMYEDCGECVADVARNFLSGKGSGA